MSADNGVYILKTKGGEFRVAHCQNIEDIYIPECRDNFKHYFDKSEVYKNLSDALKQAKILYEQIMNDFGIVEYGIEVIDLSNEFEYNKKV